VIKKLSILLIVALCLGSLAMSGCWSRREVENLAIASAIGIDTDNFKGTPKYKVICNIFRPSQAAGGGGGGGGGGGAPSPIVQPVWQISALGDTVEDALANISTRSPRDLFLGHVRLITIGKDMAKQGVHEVVDFVLRNRDIRLRTWLVVVDGKAEDALRAMPDLESNIGNQAAGISELTRYAVSKYYTEDLNRFVNTLAGEGEEPVLGRAELIKPVPPQVGTENVTTAVAYRGSAVFLEDKFVGWLEDSETKGFLFITGRSRRGVIPVSIAKGRPTVSLEMKSAESQIKPEMVEGKLHVTVKIKAEGSLQEEGRNQEMVSPQGMKELSGIYEKRVKELCMKSVEKAKQYKSDIFGFGAVLHRKHPDQWREVKTDWPNIFANAEVNVEVKGKITGTGLLSESVKYQK
jgi:spore germination protein KC